MPLVIGVEGPVACGKSTVSGILVELGAVHCDVDVVVHALYEPGKPAYRRIVKSFGKEVIGEDGRIDRKRLGAIVFRDHDRMRVLNEAIGGIADELLKALKDLRGSVQSDGVVVLEAMDLVGISQPGVRDLTWLVGCSQDIARRRLVDLRAIPTDEALARIESQKAWQSLTWRADHVFINDGPIEELVAEVKREFSTAYELYREGKLPRPKYETEVAPSEK
jgi:dephospho-CoA kinase